jgi:hypothetical protein
MNPTSPRCPDPMRRLQRPSRRSFRRFSATLAIVTGLIASTIFFASPAKAAVIYCNIYADDVHASSHVLGTVNAVGRTNCSAGVDYIIMTVSLVRNGQYVTQSGGSWTSRFGSSSLSCNASEECRSGSPYFSRVAVSAFKSGYQTVVNGSPAWSRTRQPYCWQLGPGVNMPVGGSLYSPGLAYKLVMQEDGNLVQYGPRGAMWASCTNRWPGSIATLQPDGNFVVYGPGHIARWASGTYWPGSVLQMQDDGNIVIYAPGHIAVWASAQHKVC